MVDEDLGGGGERDVLCQPFGAVQAVEVQAQDEFCLLNSRDGLLLVAGIADDSSLRIQEVQERGYGRRDDNGGGCSSALEVTLHADGRSDGVSIRVEVADNRNLSPFAEQFLQFRCRLYRCHLSKILSLQN